MKIALTTLLTVLLFNLAGAQGRFDTVDIKTTHVAGSVYMLEGAGGNIGVSAGADGVLIIDSQFGPLTPKIEAAIAKLGKGKPRFLLNTHWHGDHTGGNENFGKYATIIAHENVRTRLAAKSAKVVKAGLPVITFQQGVTVHFNGDTIKMVKLPPGHTDGDCIIFFKQANVIHMGDHFFAGRFPYIDLGSGGSVRGYLTNVENTFANLPVTSKPGVKIIPGHGTLGKKDDLEKFRDVIRASVDFVERAIRKGQSKEDIKAAAFWGQYKDWGTGFINTGRWVDIVYNELSQQK